jgi:hypothetical protein
MNMNIGVLRRQAKAMGVDNVGKTKQEIVDAIFHHGPVETPVVASDVHETQEPQAMVVYMENGQYMTVQVPLKEIKKLLS